MRFLLAIAALVAVGTAAIPASADVHISGFGITSTENVTHAKELWHRVETAEGLLRSTLQISSADDRDVANRYGNCKETLGVCAGQAAVEEKAHPIGVKVGLAKYILHTLPKSNALPDPILTVENRVVAIESLAKKAHDMAVQQSAVKQTKVVEETGNITLATHTCMTDPTSCHTECDKGDKFYCVAWARRLAFETNPPDFNEAHYLLQKACDANIETACQEVSRVDQAATERNIQVENRWAELKAAADVVAQGKFDVLKAQLYGRPSPTGWYRHGLDTMTNELLSVITDRYCPARATFVALAGQAEFTSRVKVAMEAPPLGEAYSGGTIPLTKQYTEAFATTCRVK